MGVGVAALLAWTVLTWPLAVSMTEIVGVSAYRPPQPPRFEVIRGTDQLQTMFVQATVADNLTHLREPFLDPNEGVSGPAPLKTTSLDVPWTLVVAVLRPLVGLVAAYNTTLALSSVLTALTAFGLLSRHTRWPLVAAAGALLYSVAPSRMLQLTEHFNAVMWWAIPAAAWALEVMFQRYAEGRHWLRPALLLAGVLVTVGLSGELHLDLYLAGFVSVLIAWQLVAALLGRRSIPWAPATAGVVGIAVTAAYVLWSFRYVYGGEVIGHTSNYRIPAMFAPQSIFALVRKNFGVLGEGLIYLGWGLVVLAAAGCITALVRRRAALPYAALALLLVPLTYGPTVDRTLTRVGLGWLAPYRLAFEHFPLFSLQHVPGRLMALTAMILVLLAAIAVDALVTALPRQIVPRWVATVLLIVATGWAINDYRILSIGMRPAYTSNRVVAALKASGEQEPPFLGVPHLSLANGDNSIATYLAIQTGRRTLNAYNATPVRWYAERAAALQPLNEGRIDGRAITALRAAGVQQIVVADQPRSLGRGAWPRVIDSLVATGRFRLVVVDPPFALLELQG